MGDIDLTHPGTRLCPSPSTKHDTGQRLTDSLLNTPSNNSEASQFFRDLSWPRNVGSVRKFLRLELRTCGPFMRLGVQTNSSKGDFDSSYMAHENEDQQFFSLFPTSCKVAWKLYGNDHQSSELQRFNFSSRLLGSNKSAGFVF